MGPRPGFDRSRNWRPPRRPLRPCMPYAAAHSPGGRQGSLGSHQGPESSMRGCVLSVFIENAWGLAARRALLPAHPQQHQANVTAHIPASTNVCFLSATIARVAGTHVLRTCSHGYVLCRYVGIACSVRVHIVQHGRGAVGILSGQTYGDGGQGDDGEGEEGPAHSLADSCSGGSRPLNPKRLGCPETTSAYLIAKNGAGASRKLHQAS